MSRPSKLNPSCMSVLHFWVAQNLRSDQKNWGDISLGINCSCSIIVQRRGNKVLNVCILHRFDLRKAQARQHIVEGLLKALTDLDKVVATVRAAKDGAAASKDLQSKFGLSVEQVQILLLLQIVPTCLRSVMRPLMQIKQTLCHSRL